jgi:hypothetical protein
MGYVIQIEWLSGQSRAPVEHRGRYVVSYDPDANDGGGFVVSTADPRQAQQFEGYVEAFEFWRRASTVRPVREDGKPNRPLTAYTVTIFNWEEG